jgi:hypothetical protein
MNSTLRASLLATLLTTLLTALGGCAIHVGHRGEVAASPPGADRRLHMAHHPDASNPRVLVDKGFVSVDQEPLRFFKAQGKVKITWRLPANSPYSFPNDGIVIEAAERQTADQVAEEFSCALQKNPQLFSCENRNSRPGRYKYTVRVLDNGKPLEPLDPVIINQW